MSADEQSQVRGFLLAVKFALQKHSRKDPRWTLSTARQKNMDTLAELEMKVEDAREVILSLTPMDYCRGPLRDQTIEGDLWEFGKRIRGKDVYIKLKLSGDLQRQVVRVLSFHFPERPLQYRFAQKGKKGGAGK